MDEKNKDMLEEELEAVTPDNASAIDEDLIENTAEEAVDEAIEEVADDADKAEDAAEEITEEAEKPAKKKFFLQKPVIIALCLVVAALLGYFTYVAFFLREPEGVTWTAEIDGLTYYIDFNSDNTFKAYVGSVEVDGTYSKAKDQPKPNYTGATVDETARVSTITLDYQIAYFYPNYAAEYEITGSRILGNQVFHGSYGEGYDFTLEQSKRQIPELEVSADFTPDENLLGTWVFNYEGADIYSVTFNNDGTMCIKKFEEGTTYNGTYTISDGQINFTYYVTENTVIPLDYSIDGDILSCMGVNFVREGSNATPDQPFVMTDEEAAAAQ